MNIDDALSTFMAESAELLRDMEAALMKCSGGSENVDLINLIFRSAHTIKGSAGLFGLDAVVSFMHVVESVLDEVRLGRLKMHDSLVELLLQCKDHTEDLIVHSASGHRDMTAIVKSRGDQLLSDLAQQTVDAGLDTPMSLASSSSSLLPGGNAPPATWGISMRFGPDVLRAGMDPLGFIRYLKTFGELQSVVMFEESLPSLASMDPEACYLGFDVEFSTAAEQSRIEATFEFVKEDCTLVLTPPPPDDCAPIADDDGLNAEQRVESTNPTKSKTSSATVRVDANKLDMLISRIGELIISASGTTLLARRTNSSELLESTTTLGELVEHIRESALQLRMVKIGATFNRFQRVVRDVSRELGKDIRLELSGEETELDKTVIEQIADPLTHLVRNAIDHGIESASERATAGKSPVGTVSLHASHDSGSIVIQIVDDGGGLKKEKILRKAVERGLVASDRVLSDSEIYNFIFEPGFSTAASVTNLSGRGVGMDVVKRNITSLRGSVSVVSTEGSGTTITVRLPLTLAIINGFQIGVGNSTFVLPLDAVEECIEMSPELDQDFTNLRGQVLPFIRLRKLFETAGTPDRRQSIVVVRHGDQRAGLVVDTLLGEFQTVIKPLGKLFRRINYASGSSILGTGEVALILDVDALIRHASMHDRPLSPQTAYLSPIVLH